MMKYSAALACLFSFLFVACGSDLKPATAEFTSVARGYVEAWCRGDGSVEREQFRTAELPELFRKWSQTMHTLPTSSPVEHFKATNISYSGGGAITEFREIPWCRCLYGVLVRSPPHTTISMPQDDSKQ